MSIQYLEPAVSPQRVRGQIEAYNLWSSQGTNKARMLISSIPEQNAEVMKIKTHQCKYLLFVFNVFPNKHF